MLLARMTRGAEGLVDADPLLLLRAMRLAIRPGFAADAGFARLVRKRAALLAEVPCERMGTEVDALVRSGRVGTALVAFPEAMCVVIPELRASWGFDQHSVYHVFDVYHHTAHVCNACQAFSGGLASPELQWAALLHDVAKPRTFSLDVAGHGHFFDHPRSSARMAGAIMRRLGIDLEVVRATQALIRLHDERMPCTVPAVRELLRTFAAQCPGREVALSFALFDLRRSDAVSKCAAAASWASELDRYAQALRNELRRGPVYSVRHLAVDESDVARACGTTDDAFVRLQLDVILRAVMDDELPNERGTLLAWLGA